MAEMTSSTSSQASKPAGPANPASTTSQASSDFESIFKTASFASQYRAAEKLMATYALKLLEMMQFTSYPSNAALHYLDQACGTGVCVMNALHLLANNTPRTGPTSFTAADFSPTMLDTLSKRIAAPTHESDWPSAMVNGVDISKSIPLQQSDMTHATDLPSNHFTHLTCNFGPAVCPDPRAALSEMYRVLAPGGIAGATFWLGVGWIRPFVAHLDTIRTEARSRIDQDKSRNGDGVLADLPRIPAEEGGRKLITVVTKSKDGEAWDDEALAVQEWKKAGFVDVQVERVRTVTRNTRQEIAGLVATCLNMYTALWPKEYAERVKDTDLNQRLQVCLEADLVRAGDGGMEEEKVLVWDDWCAICVTGRKPRQHPSCSDQ